MDYYNYYESPLGRLTLGSDGTHLIGLWFDGDRHYRSVLDEHAAFRKELPVFRKTAQWLTQYFSGHQPNFLPPLLVRGSEFRRNVCQILLAIPFGETRTYGEIASVVAAERGSSHMSAQAIGGAVGHNPISILIPCHRVVGKSGSLTGYGGGIQRKVWLLRHEGVDMTSLFIPKHGSAL